MPIYEYICLKCNERFSVLQGIHSKNDTKCPECSSEDVKKAISIFSCVSKGQSSSPVSSLSATGGG